MSQVYLDWNATTPPHPEVVAAMRDTAHAAWGNPSSLHAAGRTAKAIVEQAREAIAQLMGFCARDVLITSGGTEANNLAVMRLFIGLDGAAGGGTCITSRLEHPSIVAVVEQLASRGVRVIWLEVPPSGRIDPECVARALATATRPCLVAVQSVNHETGVVQPVADIVAMAARAGAEVHVDAVQAAGRLSPTAWQGAHSVAVAAHKMRGPKGIGALVVQAGVTIRPLLRGGGQERGLRPGTVDPVAAAGFGVAAARAGDGPARYARLARLRDGFEERLVALGAKLRCAAERHGASRRRARSPRLQHVVARLGGRRAGRRPRPRRGVCFGGQRMRCRDSRALARHCRDARRKPRPERAPRLARGGDDRR